jgi:hypothetical protein
MRSGQVKPMLAGVVQPNTHNTHINVLIGFVVMQLYRLEGGPMAILQPQVRPLLSRSSRSRAAFTASVAPFSSAASGNFHSALDGCGPGLENQVKRLRRLH